MSDEKLYHHPLEGFTQEEYQQFLMKVGILAFNMPVASIKAGHVNPLSTVRDYLDVPKSGDKILIAASQYLKDLLKMRTAELAQKWRNDAFESDEDWFYAVENDKKLRAADKKVKCKNSADLIEFVRQFKQKKV